jgi:hypothetical protein
MPFLFMLLFFGMKMERREELEDGEKQNYHIYSQNLFHPCFVNQQMKTRREFKQKIRIKELRVEVGKNFEEVLWIFF